MKKQNEFDVIESMKNEIRSGLEINGFWRKERKLNRESVKKRNKTKHSGKEKHENRI